MNCPNCGAVVKEGRFCNYCGAKLPDDTKRVEVNINKRIEDVAEIKRADYEIQESKLRQKLMRQEIRRGRFSRILLWLTLGGGLLALLTYLVGLPGEVYGPLFLISVISLFIGLLRFLVKV